VTDTETNRRRDRKTNSISVSEKGREVEKKQTESQGDRETDIQSVYHSVCLFLRKERNRQKARETEERERARERQTDRQTDRQADIQRSMETRLEKAFHVG